MNVIADHDMQTLAAMIVDNDPVEAMFFSSCLKSLDYPKMMCVIFTSMEEAPPFLVGGIVDVALVKAGMEDEAETVTILLESGVGVVVVVRENGVEIAPGHSQNDRLFYMRKDDLTQETFKGIIWSVLEGPLRPGGGAVPPKIPKRQTRSKVYLIPPDPAQPAASIEESERKYHDLVNSIAEYVYSVVYKNGKISSIYHSPRCEEITGYTQQEYYANPDLWSRMIHPDDRERTLAFFRDESVLLQKRAIEHRIIHKNGSIRWALNHSSLTLDKIGKAARLDGTILDITSRKLAEMSLAESEEKYRNLVENAKDIILTADISGRIQSINWKALKRSGYEIEEILNHNISEFMAPECVTATLGAFRRIAENTVKTESLELDIVAKDGKRATEEFTLQPILKEGKAVGVHGIGRDITQRKKAEKELRESENRYHALAHISPVGIFRGDTDGGFIYVNQKWREMTGIPSKGAMGYGWAAAIHEDDRDAVLQTWMRVIKGKKPLNMEFRIRKPGGEVIWVLIQSQAEMAPDGTVTGYVGTATDITARKEAEAALLEKQEELVSAKEKAESATKLKDKFLSLVAHDIRSPFASMLGLLGLLQNGEMGPLNEKQTDIISRSVEGGHRLIQMVDDLLNINRFQTGRITVSPKFWDANGVAAYTVSRLEQLAQQKGITLLNSVPLNTRIFADLELFNEVILNFVINAIKYSSHGGQIEIFIPEGRQTTIAVKDTGVGVPPDILPNLFTCDIVTTKRGTAGERGTGLGLPLAHEIMQAHGGNIDVETVVGSGSVFHANLPYVRPVVLIVENDEDERFVYMTQVGRLDVMALEAKNGVEGLQIALRKGVHLVISDIHMPVMDGYEMLTKLKNDPKTSHIPVIVLTSSSSLESREKVLRLGADDFIIKPIMENEFIPRVRRFIC